MKPASSIRGLIWQCAMVLRAAKWLVPKGQRQDWYREWYAEVWHWAHFLAESGRLDPGSKLDLARHCWGAFADAAWHRFDQARILRTMDQVPRSARFCLGSLFSLFVLALLLSGFAPTIRSGLRKLPYDHAERVALLHFDGYFAHYHDGTLFKSATDWSRRSRTASAIAAYSIQPVSVSLRGEFFDVLSTRVSPGFFELLGSQAARGRLLRTADQHDCGGCIVLSHQFWKMRFHADPDIVGKSIVLGGQEKIVDKKTVVVGGTASKIVGILPENFQFLSPEASIWTLPSSDPRASNLADQTGAVLRLKSGVTVAEAGDEFGQFTKQDDSSFGYAKARVESIQSRARQGTKLYLIVTVLSLAGCLVLASARFAVTRTKRLKLGFRCTLRWWSFLVVKILLLVSVCFVASLELTGRLSVVLTGGIHPLVGPSSTWFFLVIAMLSVSWALHDQSRRCRICLKRLGNEASVGAPSYLLLDWWGTELVCPQGHGVLHVPEMSSSWLEVDQWVCMDESWKPLFEENKAVGAR
ncbi:MAG TPA: ABC transporter permease [Terriglobales bacterium]